MYPRLPLTFLRPSRFPDTSLVNKWNDDNEDGFTNIELKICETFLKNDLLWCIFSFFIIFTLL